jgi:hypothetical protein
MTLIITAISKNGVFIRSDKRRTVKDSSGSIQRFDDIEKVFISSDKKTIIYNHGINIINGKSWYDLAIKSAKDIRHDGASDIDAALNKVEKAISADVLAKLSNNQLDDFCAFVVILKTRSNKWRAGEISWIRGQGPKKSRLGRFFWSGSGSKYLRPSKKQREDAHWASIRMREAQAQIEQLYTIAIKNQSNAHGDEFSLTYDDLKVT